MKTLRQDTARCPAPTSAAQAARVVTAGAVAVAISAVATAETGAGAMTVVTTVMVVAVLCAVLARHTLGTLFAGVALRLARPYVPGEQVRLYMPETGDVTDAEIVKLGVVSTTLGTRDGVLVVPNTRMLRVAPQCRDAA
jgi:small-conductance mechanosensitive channel